MPQIPDRAEIYDVAAKFRDECLSGKGSLVWGDQPIWSLDSLQFIRDRLINDRDETARSFFDKLKDQLSGAPDAVVQVTVDILGFYYLYPSRTSEATKLDRMREVAGWRGLSSHLSLGAITRAFHENGIGHPGTYYNTGMPAHIAFIAALGIETISAPESLSDPRALERAADRAMRSVSIGSAGLMRNVALHLLLPDSFERMGTDSHKNQVLNAFSQFDSGIGSVDERLQSVRVALGQELGRTDFDFYDDGIKARWSDLPTRRIWIEKTKVLDRPDRKAGPNALGQALWSPQRDKGNKDIYKAMREVREGDIVLHLTDNTEFSGISEAAGSCDEFTPPPSTEWSERPSYRVPLRHFRALNPPLSRKVFFGPLFGERLIAYAKIARESVFYNSEPNLNQGAYLTEAKPGLVEILTDAYCTISSIDLISGTVDEGKPKKIPNPPPAMVKFVESYRDFSSALLDCNLNFGNRHDTITRSFFVSLATKRLVILTGLSGSGKTQLALKFGEWIGEDRMRVVPVRPDWTGAEALFGFEDGLQKKAPDGRRAWHVPEPLRHMLRAAADPQRPYLLVLDEMNLAHVERYFADVLSGMESNKGCLPSLARDAEGQWRSKSVEPEFLPIPTNLFIVGTVNVDETTYMFSPKVLDRANTFEFRVQTADLVAGESGLAKCTAAGEASVEAFLRIACDNNSHRSIVVPDIERFTDRMRQLHALLATHSSEFGHRTFADAIRFAALLNEAGDASIESALDLQVMQKILPRLHGARRRLEPVLLKLGEFCLNPGIDHAGIENSTWDGAIFDSEAPVLPISFDKVRRMLASLRINQFASFTE